MFRTVYTLIMDPEANGLNRVPKIVRFQLMTVLALLWSVAFSTWTGLVTYLGLSIFAHLVLLLATFFTAEIYGLVRQTERVDHRRMYRDPKDGCARYDDIWGG